MTKSPVVKFSPFEALLIGEKNKIVTRNRRTKNAIFIAKALHQQRKTFNLRDLFDLDVEDASCPPNPDKNKDRVVFKMPQRVREFLKTRNRNVKPPDRRDNNDLLYIDCNPKRIIANNAQHSKSKNSKVKSKKIKFKRKLNSASTTTIRTRRNNNSVNNSNSYRPPTRVVKKFPSHVSRVRFNRVTNNITTITKRLVSRDFDRNNKSHALKITNKHLLRGADGRFISKKEYNQINSVKTATTINSEESSLPCQINETKTSNKVQDVKESMDSHLQFSFCPNDCKIPPNPKLPHLPEYLTDCSSPHFHFPKYPPRMKINGGGDPLDDDKNLMDLIYENFPPFIFGGGEGEGNERDFADFLRTEGLIPPKKNVKMYQKKRNGFFAGDKLTDIFNNHLPYIKFKKLDDINSIYGTKGFPPVIDEPCTKKNHLIKTKSFDCLFLRSSEGKEIVIGNLMKPFWPNTWFGRLPNI